MIFIGETLRLIDDQIVIQTMTGGIKDIIEKSNESFNIKDTTEKPNESST